MIPRLIANSDSHREEATHFLLISDDGKDADRDDFANIVGRCTMEAGYTIEEHANVWL